MGTLLEQIFYVLVMSSLFFRSEATVHSTPDTALKFSQCLIDRIGESPFFTVGERDIMIEVADTMAKTMRHELSGYSMTLSTKVLTIAFVTSMADVVILEDSTRNILRKEVYSESLEQCSISATGYIDTEFINEALNIMTTLEGSKAVRFGEASAYSDSSYYSEGHFEPGLRASEEYFNPDLRTPEEYFDPDLPTSDPGLHTSDEYYRPGFHASDKIFNPHAVQPSPVVTPINPVPANFNPILGLPQSSFQFSAVPSAWQPNANIHLPNQPESYIHPPPRFDSPGIFQSGGNFGVAPSLTQGSISPVLGPSAQLTSPETRGLSIPQTKQSEVVAIPPSSVHQFEKIPFQDQSVPKTSEGQFQLSDLSNTSTEKGKSFPITSSASLPQINEQGSDAFNTPLESIIYNILSNSPNFRNAFRFGIDQQHALNLARTITEQSLSDHEDIVNDAIKAVSDAISTISFKSPLGYARAIANSLASVLQHNGMSLFEDGARTASGLLANLPDTKQISQPVVPTDDGKNFRFDFEAPTVAPEGINGEIFGNTLRQYLRESPEISSIFCTPTFSTGRIQVYFSIIKASLSDYGREISSLAASVASEALAELSQQDMCAKYSRVISQAIAEILEENRLLNNANPEEIFNRMKFSLKQKQTLTAQSQQPQSVQSNTSNSSSKDIGTSFAQNAPTLHPSFSSIPNKYEEEPKVIPLNFNPTPTDYVSSTTTELYTTSILDLSEVTKKQEKYVEETKERTFTGSSIPIPISSINKPVTESEERSDLDILTTAIFTDVTDEEFTSVSSLIDSDTSISESTDDTLSSSDYTTEDYEDLVDFLFDELESTLNGQSGDNTESSTKCASELSSRYNEKFSEKEVSNSDDSSVGTAKTTSSENDPRNKDMSQTEYANRNRRKMKRKTTMLQMDTTTQTPNTRFNDKWHDVNPPLALTRTASRRPPGSRSRVQAKDLPSDGTSRNYPLKYLPEETGDSTVFQNKPVRSRNSRRRSGSLASELQDSSFGDSLLTSRTVDDDRVSSDKPLRGASRRLSGSTHKIQEKDVLPEESFSSSSSFKRPPVRIQASFQDPLSSASYPSVRMSSKRNSSRSSDINDPKTLPIPFARSVSRIATSSIEYIRSDRFNFYELCGRLNELASIVKIPPLDYCSEIPLIDFLLHVLRSVTNTQKSV